MRCITQNGCAVSILAGFQDQQHKALTSWSDIVAHTVRSRLGQRPTGVPSDLNPHDLRKSATIQRKGYTQPPLHLVMGTSCLQGELLSNPQQSELDKHQCDLTLASTVKKETHTNSCNEDTKGFAEKIDKACD